MTNDLSKDLEQLKSLEIIDVSNLEYLGNMAGIVVQETDTEEVWFLAFNVNFKPLECHCTASRIQNIFLGLVLEKGENQNYPKK